MGCELCDQREVCCGCPDRPDECCCRPVTEYECTGRCRENEPASPANSEGLPPMTNPTFRQAIKEIPSALDASVKIRVDGSAGTCCEISLFQHEGRFQGSATMTRTIGVLDHGSLDRQLEAILQLRDIACALLNGDPQ